MSQRVLLAELDSLSLFKVDQRHAPVFILVCPVLVGEGKKVTKTSKIRVKHCVINFIALCTVLCKFILARISTTLHAS